MLIGVFNKLLGKKHQVVNARNKLSHCFLNIYQLRFLIFGFDLLSVLILFLYSIMSLDNWFYSSPTIQGFLSLFHVSLYLLLYLAFFIHAILFLFGFSCALTTLRRMLSLCAPTASQVTDNVGYTESIRQKMELKFHRDWNWPSNL